MSGYFFNFHKVTIILIKPKSNFMINLQSTLNIKSFVSFLIWDLLLGREREREREREIEIERMGERTLIKIYKVV